MSSNGIATYSHRKRLLVCRATSTATTGWPFDQPGSSTVPPRSSSLTTLQLRRTPPCASDSSNVHRWSFPSPPESVASNRRPPGIGWYGERPALCWDKESGFPEGEVTGVHNPDVKLPPFSTEPSQYTDPSG